jgi:hypothetical protein
VAAGSSDAMFGGGTAHSGEVSFVFESILNFFSVFGIRHDFFR